MGRKLLVAVALILFCQSAQAKPNIVIEKHNIFRADNSGRNTGDNRPGAITPQVQSLKSSDLRIVRAIRKAMIKDPNLSTNAKNAKVIVINGKVILRGPVASAREKHTIFKLAENSVGAENILNKLEVLPK
ncbi:MAG: BON domain-containing protein [Candidatus Melainabacteria bacterium]|nr:BON domain-containing protein [Candidatus Melainabacteria bacterium]